MSEQSKQPTTEMTQTEFLERTLRIGIWGAHVVLPDYELVKLAERSMMRRGGVAERCLEWYLRANGHDVKTTANLTVARLVGSMLIARIMLLAKQERV